MLIVQRPQIEEQPVSDYRSRFLVEPLEPGFGYTLGNTLRRTLLSRIPGAAVTSLQIEGVQHEFSTVPGVVEDVVDIILNVKQIVVRLQDTDTHTLYLSAKGPGDVTASQLKVPAGVEIVNGDLHIATLSANARFEMELTVGPGVGYRSADRNKSADAIGIIPIDSIFSPVKTVAYRVESTQVGQMTNFDRLVLDVETNGAINPGEAVSSAGKTLRELLGLVRRPRHRNRSRVGRGGTHRVGLTRPRASHRGTRPLRAAAATACAVPRSRRSGSSSSAPPTTCSTSPTSGRRAWRRSSPKLDELGLSLTSSNEVRG